MEKYLIVLFIIIIVGNIYGFVIKKVLKNNGFDVKYFSGYFIDFKNIFKLAKIAEDKDKRKRYILMGLTEVILGLTFMITGILLFLSLPSFNDSACKAFAAFKNQEYKAVVIDKYYDKKEHSYPTLICKDLNGNKIVNQNFIFDNSGSFDYIQIGDILNKKKNEEYIQIKNAKVDTLIALDFRCVKKQNNDK
jgi:hypothetical protein